MNPQVPCRRRHHCQPQAEPQNAKGINKPESYHRPYYDYYCGDDEDHDRFVVTSELNSSPNYASLRSVGDQSMSSWANIDVTKVDFGKLDHLLKDVGNTNKSNGAGDKMDPTTARPKSFTATTNTNTLKKFGCRAARDDSSSACWSVSSWGDIDIDIDDQPTIPDRPSSTSDNTIHRRRRQSHPVLSSPPPPPPPPPRPLVQQDDARKSSWGEAEIFVPPCSHARTTMINNNHGGGEKDREQQQQNPTESNSAGRKACIKKKHPKKQKSTTAEIKPERASGSSRRWSSRIDSILSGGLRLKEARRSIQEQRKKSSLTTTTTTTTTHAPPPPPTTTTNTTTASMRGQWTKLSRRGGGASSESSSL